MYFVYFTSLGHRASRQSKSIYYRSHNIRESDVNRKMKIHVRVHSAAGGVWRTTITYFRKQKCCFQLFWALAKILFFSAKAHVCLKSCWKWKENIPSSKSSVELKEIKPGKKAKKNGQVYRFCQPRKKLLFVPWTCQTNVRVLSDSLLFWRPLLHTQKSKRPLPAVQGATKTRGLYSKEKIYVFWDDNSKILCSH